MRISVSLNRLIRDRLIRCRPRFQRWFAFGLVLVLASVVAACSDSSPTAIATTPLADTSPPKSTDIPPIPTDTPTQVVVPRAEPTRTPGPTSTTAPAPSPTSSLSGSVSQERPDTPTSRATATAEPESGTASTIASAATNGLTETALGFVTHLAEELGLRESATQEELDAAEYIASQLEGFGYSVEIQQFTVDSIIGNISSVNFDDSVPSDIRAIPLVRSGFGTAIGDLVAVGLAQEGELPESGLEGNIAFAERGIISFEEKVTRLAEAGAIGVIIYNNVRGDFRGTLATTARIPAISISQSNGRRIERLLAERKVAGEISVLALEFDSRNVVAKKIGEGEHVVVWGGHYDSVPGVIGANDNASGTGVILTLAKELADDLLPFNIRIIAFGSEELGLLGSGHYVSSLPADQLDRISRMFNFDALGSGTRVGVLGSMELTELALDQGENLGIDVRVTPGLRGGSSDHANFANAGIPVIMFFAEDFSRLHTPGDTIEFVDPQRLGESAALALAILRSKEFQKALD